MNSFPFQHENAVRGFVGIILLAVLIFLSGCGYSTGDVSGVVRFDGQPLEAGMVTFHHTTLSGRNIIATVQPDGTYQALHCPTGPVKVTVQAMPSRNGGASNPKSRSSVPAVPTRFNDPDTTDLVLDVSRGSQTFDIDLTP